MKTIHLHIGSYKTGTTSIQQTFYKNQTILNKQNFNYAGGDSNHHFSFFATNASQHDWPRQFKGINERILHRKIKNYFLKLENGFQADFNHQIISTEYLFIDNTQYIKNYLSYLREYFSKIKVYVFVRDPVDYYKSIQQQMIKARSYVTSPQAFLYNFKNVIEAWSQFCPIKVIEYTPGVDSSEILSDKMGIDFKKLSKPDSYSNTSLSMQQIALLEKLQVNLYRDKEDQFKPHLGVIQQINTPTPDKPKLKLEVQRLIQKKHHAELEWLKKECGIDFFKKIPVENYPSPISNFENGKASIRDVYQIESEQSVERYEALVMDALLKKLVQSYSKSTA